MKAPLTADDGEQVRHGASDEQGERDRADAQDQVDGTGDLPETVRRHVALDAQLAHERIDGAAHLLHVVLALTPPDTFDGLARMPGSREPDPLRHPGELALLPGLDGGQPGFVVGAAAQRIAHPPHVRLDIAHGALVGQEELVPAAEQEAPVARLRVQQIAEHLPEVIERRADAGLPFGVATDLRTEVDQGTRLRQQDGQGAQEQPETHANAPRIDAIVTSHRTVPPACASRL